jgi:hypothetical protein
VADVGSQRSRIPRRDERRARRARSTAPCDTPQDGDERQEPFQRLRSLESSDATLR